METGRVEEAMHRAVAEGVVAGMVLVACQGTDGPHVVVAGAAALQPAPEPMQRQTIFDLASLTKVFSTTTLAMLLCERRQLALDVPLGAHLPGQHPAPIAGLTPRLLLAHAAGLPATIRLYSDLEPETPDPVQRRLELLRVVRGAPLAHPPGTRTCYSDIGMILLGDALEQLAGARQDQLFEAAVAGPLDLHDTFYRYAPEPLAKSERDLHAFAATEQCAWRGRLIRGQVHDENAYALGGVAGHAGLFATAADLFRLSRVLLDAYHGRSRFLQAATVRAFTRTQELIPGSARGLGWGKPEAGASCGAGFGPEAFGHTGFTGTSAWIDPAAERIVLLLSNRVHPHRDNQAFLRFRPQLHDLVVASFS